MEEFIIEFEIENGVLKEYNAEDGVTEVVIPDGVTSIGVDAFYECTSLESIKIPAGVTSVLETGLFSVAKNLKA